MGGETFGNVKHSYNDKNYKNNNDKNNRNYNNNNDNNIVSSGLGSTRTIFYCISYKNATRMYNNNNNDSVPAVDAIS